MRHNGTVSGVDRCSFTQEESEMSPRRIGLIAGATLVVLAGSLFWLYTDHFRSHRPSDVSSRATPVRSWPTAPTMGNWSQPVCGTAGAAGGEVQGTASACGQIWGLILGPVPVQAGTDTKVIVRMTGTGNPAVYADGPAGHQIAPDLGPKSHAGSSWSRPGDEWATFFTFPAAGCWNIRVVRATVHGSIPLRVLSPASP